MGRGRATLLSVAFFALIVSTGSSACRAQTRDVLRRSTIDDPPAVGHSSMVIVSSNIAPHQDAIGAGVVVALSATRLRVMTARHVADCGPVTIWINGRPHPAEITRTFAERDLALVDAFGTHFDRLPVEPAAVAAAPPPGSSLSIWGEDETGLRFKSGAVISTMFSPGDRSAVPLLSFTCETCSRGDSGGGVFDRAGHLLAILTGRYFGANNRTIAIVGEPLDASLYSNADGQPQVLTTLEK